MTGSTDTAVRDVMVGYLEDAGWVAPTKPGPLGGLWSRPDTDFRMPVPHVMVPRGIDWEVITERLAWLEGVSVVELRETLLRRARQ